MSNFRMLLHVHPMTKTAVIPVWKCQKNRDLQQGQWSEDRARDFKPLALLTHLPIRSPIGVCSYDDFTFSSP